MIQIVYTDTVCEKYSGACLKGSHYECEAGCQYQLDKGKVPSLEGGADYYQTATPGCSTENWLCYSF